MIDSLRGIEPLSLSAILPLVASLNQGIVASLFYEQQVQQIIAAVEVGLIPSGQYGAVLIDEGHDFEPHWLKLAVQMVDAETNSLLLLYDDAQNLYGAKKRKPVSFNQIGIQARGRTTMLKVNYRNIYEVLTTAYEFAKHFLTSSTQQEEDTPLLVLPESAGRHGATPELIHLPSFKQELTYLIDRLHQFHNQGTAWNQIAIIYRAKWMATTICKAMEQAHLPLEWVTKDHSSRYFQPQADSIKLITMHSSKGLEFPVVVIPGVGFMPTQTLSAEEESRLLYVAMTRAIDRLVLTWDRQSEFVKRLEVALSQVA